MYIPSPLQPQFGIQQNIEGMFETKKDQWLRGIFPDVFGTFKIFVVFLFFM